MHSGGAGGLGPYEPIGRNERTRFRNSRPSGTTARACAVWNTAGARRGNLGFRVLGFGFWVLGLAMSEQRH